MRADLVGMSDARRIVSHVIGKKVSRSTLHRWATNGVRGTVLETVRIGGRRFTSADALERFCDGQLRGIESGGDAVSSSTERILKERGLI